MSTFAVKIEGDDTPPVIVDLPDSGEKPVDGSLSCSICGKSDFTTERGYKIHQTRMHGVGGDSSPKTGSKKNKASMEEAIFGTYAMVAMVASFFQPKDGQIIMANAEECAKAWDAACQQNDSIRKAWQKITTVSVWGMVATAHAPIVTGIMANHQMMPQAIAEAVSNGKVPDTVATAESSFHTVDGGYVE